MKLKVVFEHYRYFRSSHYEGVPLNRWLVEVDKTHLANVSGGEDRGAPLFETGGQTECHIKEYNESGQLVRAYVGVANCSVDDKYDPKVGEAIAFMRAHNGLHLPDIKIDGLFTCLHSALSTLAVCDKILLDAGTHASVMAGNTPPDEYQKLCALVRKRLRK